MLPSAGDFVLDRKSKRIGIKSALMEYAALQRRLQITRYSRSVIVIEADGFQLGFNQMNGVLSSQVGRFFCDRKEQGRKRLAEARVTVTPSQIFRRKDRGAAWAYAQTLGSEVVIKPTTMARGRGVTTNISTAEQFDSAWKHAFSAYRNPASANVLVEKQMPGEDYRFYVVGRQTVFCTQRKRANVTGDGQSSLKELIEFKNEARSQNPYLMDYLIPTNPAELDRLPLYGWTLDHVPTAGEEVELRGASNLSAGGDSIDCTDVMHPDYKDIVIRTVEAIPGMEYAGVDIIAPSITDAPTPQNHAIGEVEYSPAPLSHFPAEGAARDMTGELLDFYLERFRPVP
ncbi:MAG: hypothetical protein ACTHWO_06715 [Nesterenkonia sp.]